MTPSAAFTGNFGLEVQITTCSVSQDLLLEPPLTTLTGLYEACGTLAATDVSVVTPGATFNAGEAIELGDGFRVAQGASFEAGIRAPLTPYSSVEDQSPSGESNYQASFYVRLDDLTLAEGEELDHLVGHSNSGRSAFRLVLKRDVATGENRLTLAARLDDLSEEITPWGEEILLPPGWNHVEIDWSRGSGNGQLLASVNGSAYTGLSNLQNLSQRIESVRWGSVSGTVVSSIGAMQLDDFSSSRSGGTQDVMLAWNDNIEPDLAGYFLHYGTQSGNYTVHIDVGDTTIYTVPDLMADQTYYFAVTAYDTGQNESALSDELPVILENVIFQDGFESGATDNWGL